MFVSALFLVADLHYTVLPISYGHYGSHMYTNTLGFLSRLHPRESAAIPVYCVGTYLSEFMEIKCRCGDGRKFSDLLRSELRFLKLKLDPA